MARLQETERGGDHTARLQMNGMEEGEKKKMDEELMTHNFSSGSRCGCISARSPPGRTSKAALLSSETPRCR